MYVTAHRVRSSKTGREGVNAYLHRHGAVAWPAHAEAILGLIEENPGELTDQELQLTPVGGNDVLSYLDVLAPDDTPRSEVVRALDAVFQAGGEDGLVAVCTGPIVMRFGVGQSLARHWQEELDKLARAVEDLLRRESRLKVGRPSMSRRRKQVTTL